MDAAHPPAPLEFGRFKVVRHRRELLVDGRAVELGGRAFDTLIALIDARGSIVDKDRLMRRVWPDRVVEENNLQAQISASRSEEHTSELQSQSNLVCPLLLEKKKDGEYARPPARI